MAEYVTEFPAGIMGDRMRAFFAAYNNRDPKEYETWLLENRSEEALSMAPLEARVEQFSRGTRTLVLFQQKKQTARELAVINSRLRRSPGNMDLLREKVDLELELDAINYQLKRLAPKKR